MNAFKVMAPESGPSVKAGDMSADIKGDPVCVAGAPFSVHVRAASATHVGSVYVDVADTESAPSSSSTDWAAVVGPVAVTSGVALGQFIPCADLVARFARARYVCTSGAGSLYGDIQSRR
jgi:hypothetical protein